MPPLHSEVVTATIAKSTDLRPRRHDLEQALRRSTTRYSLDPAGLGVTVAWGLPYFDRARAAQATRISRSTAARRSPSLLPTRRFPSDPN